MYTCTAYVIDLVGCHSHGLEIANNNIIVNASLQTILNYYEFIVLSIDITIIAF